MPRTQVEVEIIGLDQVKAMNTALTTHGRIVSQLAGIYQQFNSAVGASAGAVRQATGAQTSFNQNLQQTASLTNNAARSSENFLGSLLKYRLAAETFSLVTRSIQEAGKAILAYDQETARISRVTGPQGKPMARAEMEDESVRTGITNIKQLGEAYYQLSISVKNAAEMHDAYKTTIALVAGQEGDARETARGLVQIHALFRDELNRTIPAAEQYSRIGEAVSLVWKNGNLELPEFIQTLKYLGPVMKGVGADLSQTFALAQVFSEMGMRGRMIGTGMGNLAQHVFGQSAQINKKLQSQGFEPIQVFTNEHGGMDVARMLDDIITKMGRLRGSARDTYAQIVGGNQNAVRALLALDTTATHKLLESVQQYQDGLAGKTHTTEQVLSEQLNNFTSQWHRAWNGVIDMIDIAIGKASQLSGLTIGLKSFADLMQQRTHQEVYNAQEGQTLRTEAPAAHAQHMLGITQAALLTARPGADGRVFTRDIQAAMTPTQWGALHSLIHPHEVSGLLGNVKEAEYVTVDELRALEQNLQQQYAGFSSQEAAIARAAQPPPVKPHHYRVDEWNKDITLAASRTHLPPALIKAVMQAESEGDPNSVSSAGAIGLMQLMPGTAKGLGVNPRDPKDNIWGGANYLGQLLQEFNGNLSLALAAYNAGDGAVKKYHGIPPYGETQAYVKKVERLYQQFGGAGGKLNVDSFDYMDQFKSSNSQDPERAAEEARRKQIKRLRDRQRIAQDDFKEAQKRLTDFAKDQDRPLDPKAFDAKLKPLQKAYDAAKASLTKITGQVASAEKDPATLRLIKKGTLIEDTDLDDQRRSNLEKYLKAQADRKADYADLAVQKYGLFDPTTAQRAMQAQEAAIKAAQQQGDLDEVSRLTTHRSGPLRTFLDQYSQGTQSEVESGKGILDFWNKTSLGSGESIINDTQRRLRDIDLGQRPENLFSNQKEGALEALTQKQSVLQEGLTALGPATNENRDQFERLSDELRQVNQEIGNFKDKIAGEKFHQALQDLGDKTKHSLDILDMKSGLKQYLNPDSAKDQQRQLLQQTIGYYAGNLSDVQALASTATGDAQREANKAVEQAQLQLEQSKYNLQKLDSEYQFKQREHFAGMASSAAVELYHGEKPDKVFSKLGDQVVSNAIQKLIGSAFDPHTVAVRQNTQAISLLTGAISGHGAGSISATAGSLTDGVQKLADIGSGNNGDASKLASFFGMKGGSGSIGGTNKTGTYVNDALAAYGVFSQGMQQGSSLGSVLGAAGAGFAMGGPIGAAIGGGLNLLGGLFHHSNPENKNPALFHGPSDFEYDAYRQAERSGRSVSLPHPSSAAPPITVEVHTYNDGVKTSVQKVLAQTTRAGQGAYAASHFDHYQPH